jgi:hypothetical protein
MQQAAATKLCAACQTKQAALLARYMAALLVGCAARDLPPLAGNSGSSSSSSGGNSKLTAMLWEQIEQSGLLQQLPQAVGIILETLPQGVKPLPAGDLTNNVLTDDFEK